MISLISRDIYEKAVKSTPGVSSKKEQKQKGISQDAYTKAKQSRYEYEKRETQNFFSNLSKTDNWTTQHEMDRHIFSVKSRAQSDTANASVYNEILSTLNKRKEEYGKFQNAAEYNAAVQEAIWLRKYGDMTYDDVRKEIDIRTRSKELAGIDPNNEDEELKWLKNYVTNVGYKDPESYDKEIADLNLQLEENAKRWEELYEKQFEVGNDASLSIDELNAQLDEIRKQQGDITVLNGTIDAKISNFKRKKEQALAQKEINEKYMSYRIEDDFARYADMDTGVAKRPYMTNEEQEVFSYLYNKYGWDDASKFEQAVKPLAQQRMHEEQTKAAREFADIPVVSSIVSLGSQLLDGALMAPIKFVGSLTGDYQKNWASYDTLTNFTTTVRSERAAALADWTGWEGAGFAYNVGMSIFDMLTAIAVSKGVGAASAASNSEKVVKAASQIIMSSEAASHTMTDARERGLDGWKIASLGLASAGIEALTEKYSLDALFAEPKHWATHVLKNIGTEASEEAVANVLNTLADEVVAGNQSVLKQQIRDYMADGLSYAEATQKVLLAKAEEIGLDALGGALSGGIMGGGSAIINHANTRANTVQYAVPSTKIDSLPDTQVWVSEKFNKQKTGVNVKGLGAVTVDNDSMKDAIAKTANADQAVMFVALNSTLKKGTVITEQMFQNDTAVAEEAPKQAAIVAPVTLNGNTHFATISTVQTQSGQYLVNGITLDGETIYDASTYAKPVQDTAAANGGTAQDAPQMQSAENGSLKRRADDEEHIYTAEDDVPTELDTAFANMSEERRAELISTIEKNTGVKIVFDETLDAKGKYKSGVITINPNVATPMTVLKHELTHYLEVIGLYNDLMDFAFDKSETFKAWMREKGHENIDAFAKKVVDDRADTNHPLGQDGRNAMHEAKQEILADFVGEKLFRDVNALAELAQKKRPLFERIREWFKNLFNRNRGTAMEKDLRRMEKLFEQAVGQRRNISEQQDAAKYKFDGYSEDGRGKYQSNFQKGTPKSAKSERILKYIQNVWSKKPIRLVVKDGGVERHIYAQFDPTYDETGNTPTDASKLMGGNRHGTASDQRVTLDLADDYYQIASESTYNYSKDETGKDHPAHKDVNKWHYFVNDIYFAEYGSDEYTPYRVTINVKEKTDGQFVYSFSAEKIRGQDAPQTLHAAVNEGEIPNANDLSSDPIKPQNGNGVNPYSTQETEKYSPFMTAERKNTTGQSAEQPSGNVDLSSFSTEELRAELAARNPKEGIADIARLQPQDATTTPNLRDSGVRNRKGDGNSAFAESIQATDIFDDQLKELAATDDVISRYDRIANDETMEAANKALNEGGNSYVDGWKNKPSKSFTATDVAVGFILMSRYQKIGDYQNAVIVAQKLREVGTVAGQTVQIFSILSRLTPEGMMAYAQHELDLAWKQMIVGKTRKWVEANQWRAQLTAEDCEYIVRKTLQAAALPEGRDKNIRLAEIGARIQSKIPQQKGQAFKAWQRTAMLLNPKTQLRNVLGNATMMPQHIVSDLIGTVIDKGISKATGKRTTSGVHLSGKAFKQGLFESWDDFVRHINTRGINQDRFEISGQSLDNFNEHHDGRISRALNPMSRALNALDRFNSFLLDAGDRSFYQMWFINSLNGQMKANHATEPTAEMIEVATQDALQRTWQDVNTMTQAVGWIKEAMNTIRIRGYGLGDVVVKFVKTPANITKAIFDFSPAGFVKALAIDARKFKIAVENGQVTAQMQRNLVKSLSNGITGSVMMLIAGALAKAGLLTGKKDEDKDVSDFERYVLGQQSYSVKIGNTYFSYDWAQPTAAMWAMAADYFSDKKNAELTGEEKGMFQTILDAIKVGGQVLYNQSFMTSIQNLFSDDGFIPGLINAVLQDPSAMVPQLFSQMAAAADPSVRNSYENGDNWKTAINKVLYKIPAARNTLAESVDALGNTKTQYGNDIQRTIASFFSVANIQQGYESKAGEEIYRLYQSTGSVAVIPSAAPNSVQYKDKDDNIVKITLSSHDKEAYTKVSGKTVESAVEKLVGIKTYGGLSDENKAKLMSELYSYAKQKANNEVLGIDLNDDAAKAESFISQGIPVEQYFLVRAIKNSDESDLDGSGGIGQDEAQAILDSTTLTKKQKEILWTSFSSKWKSNPYKHRYY